MATPSPGIAGDGGDATITGDGGIAGGRDATGGIGLPPAAQEGGSRTKKVHGHGLRGISRGTSAAELRFCSWKSWFRLMPSRPAADAFLTHSDSSATLPPPLIPSRGLLPLAPLPLFFLHPPLWKIPMKLSLSHTPTHSLALSLSLLSTFSHGLL